MSSAVELERDIDRTDVPYIVRGAVKIGLITAIAVLLYSLVSRYTSGWWSRRSRSSSSRPARGW